MPNRGGTADRARVIGHCCRGQIEVERRPARNESTTRNSIITVSAVTLSTTPAQSATPNRIIAAGKKSWRVACRATFM